MLQPWQKGKVLRIEQTTPNTRRFWIEIIDIPIFNFQPGQFVTLDLPIHEQRNKRWRSYSIASWPDNTNVIELVIVFSENGTGTQYLFNEVHEGSELTLRGPQGIFVLPAIIDKDLFLICTGTGIAPFRSMVHHIKNHNIAHKHIHILFGCRTQQDLLYYNEMKTLEKEMLHFHYTPTLSREQWEGKTGYVHALYEELSINKPNAQFFLCGWKNMIDEARQKLQQLGYDKKQIHFELYG